MSCVKVRSALTTANRAAQATRPLPSRTQPGAGYVEDARGSGVAEEESFEGTEGNESG